MTYEKRFSAAITSTKEFAENHDAHNDNQKNNRIRKLEHDFYFAYLIDVC